MHFVAVLLNIVRKCLAREIRTAKTETKTGRIGDWHKKPSEDEKWESILCGGATLIRNNVYQLGGVTVASEGGRKPAHVAYTQGLVELVSGEVISQIGSEIVLPTALPLCTRSDN